MNDLWSVNIQRKRWHVHSNGYVYVCFCFVQLNCSFGNKNSMPVFVLFIFTSSFGIWVCMSFGFVFFGFLINVFIFLALSLSLTLSLCLLAQFFSYSPPDSIRTKHAGVLYRCRCIHRKMHFCIRRDGRRARVHTFIDCHSQIFMINRRPFGGNL